MKVMIDGSINWFSHSGSHNVLGQDAKPHVATDEHISVWDWEKKKNTASARTLYRQQVLFEC